MEPNVEKTYDKLGLEKASTKLVEGTHENSAIIYNSVITSMEKEIKPHNDDKKTENKISFEQLDSNIITTLSTKDENVENAKFVRGEKYSPNHGGGSNNDTKQKISPEMSKKSAEGEESKARKRVHFKSEVETLTYHSGLSMWENYDYTEEFSLPGGIGPVSWKSEINLAAYSRPCNQCSFMEEWVRCEHGFRRLRRERIPIRQYTRLNDEVIGDVPQKKRKVRPILKRSASCFIPTKNNNERANENPNGGNLMRRFSKSMHNLKTETFVPMFERFKARVTKKKKENAAKPLWVHDGVITDIPFEEFKNSPKWKTIDSFLEGDIENPCATSRNAGLRRWKSVGHILKKENSSTLESSKSNAENIFNEYENGWNGMQSKVKLLEKKKCEDNKESSCMYSKPLLSWNMMQNSNIDT